MLSRRDLLRGVPAALAGDRVAGQTPPPKKAGIRSSVMLWTLPGSFEERLEAAARAGLQSVEFSSEHSGWSDIDIRRVRRATRSLRLGIDAIGAVPHWDEQPVSMVDPAQRTSLLGEVGRNIALAEKLEVPMLMLPPGRELPGLTRKQQFANLVESCTRCGELADRSGIDLVIEPRNNMAGSAGSLLTTCGEALELIRQVDHPRLRLLFDVYHEQVQTGHLLDTIRKAAPYTALYHVADNPGRHEPGTGEIDFPNLYKAITESGYEGYVAMEYLPTRDAVKSLTDSIDAMRAALG